MRLNNVVLVGMGALGILFGAHLNERLGREHVGFAVDESRMARYSAQRFTANGKPCDFRLLPTKTAEPADLVIFAVKAPQLKQAMEDAAGFVGRDTVIMSLLNGITSEKALEECFGAKNVVYCVAQGMDAVRDGAALTYEHMGVLCVGIPDGMPEKQPALDAVCELFDRTGLPHRLEADIQHRLWSKWMLNVGVNQVVMVEEGTYGTVQRPGPARDQMVAAMREVLALARLEGVNVTEDDIDGYLALIDTLAPEGMPSMRQDGLAHRPSEVELFAGAVRRMARRHGLPTPVNDALYERVMAMEAKY